MTDPFKNLKLDAYEQALEDDFENADELTGEELEKKMKVLKEAAQNFNKQKKDKRITIRIYSEDLEKIRKLAYEEGMPYQTYLTSLLHKITTGKLQLKAA